MSQSCVPKVSVILPAYNRALFLRQAVQSILRQTLTDWELIIVDDGSTDATPDVGQSFAREDSRIAYYRHDVRQGVSVTRNTAISHSKGTYLAFQDDDDISHPERLLRQVSHLEKNPHIVMLRLRLFNFSGNRSLRSRFSWRRSKPMLAPLFATTMGHAELMKKVAFRAFFSSAEDEDYTLRVLEYARYQPGLAYLPATLESPHPLYARRQADSPDRLSISPLSELYYMFYRLSEGHRRHGLPDPIDNALTFEDAIRNIHPEFFTYAQEETELIQTMTKLIQLYRPLVAGSMTREEQLRYASVEQLAAQFPQLVELARKQEPPVRALLFSSVFHNDLSGFKYAMRRALLCSSSSRLLWKIAPEILLRCCRRQRWLFIFLYLRTLWSLRA